MDAQLEHLFRQAGFPVAVARPALSSSSSSVRAETPAAVPAAAAAAAAAARGTIGPVYRCARMTDLYRPAKASPPDCLPAKSDFRLEGVTDRVLRGTLAVNDPRLFTFTITCGEHDTSDKRCQQLYRVADAEYGIIPLWCSDDESWSIVEYLVYRHEFENSDKGRLQLQSALQILHTGMSDRTTVDMFGDSSAPAVSQSSQVRRKPFALVPCLLRTLELGPEYGWAMEMLDSPCNADYMIAADVPHLLRLFPVDKLMQLTFVERRALSEYLKRVPAIAPFVLPNLIHPEIRPGSNDVLYTRHWPLLEKLAVAEVIPRASVPDLLALHQDSVPVVAGILRAHGIDSDTFCVLWFWDMYETECRISGSTKVHVRPAGTDQWRCDFGQTGDRKDWLPRREQHIKVLRMLTARLALDAAPPALAAETPPPLRTTMLPASIRPTMTATSAPGGDAVRRMEQRIACLESEHAPVIAQLRALGVCDVRTCSDARDLDLIASWRWSYGVAVEQTLAEFCDRRREAGAPDAHRTAGLLRLVAEHKMPQLSDEQRRAGELMRSSALVVVSGNAGCGKSQIIKMFHDDGELSMDDAVRTAHEQGIRLGEFLRKRQQERDSGTTAGSTPTAVDVPAQQPRASSLVQRTPSSSSSGASNLPRLLSAMASVAPTWHALPDTDGDFPLLDDWIAFANGMHVHEAHRADKDVVGWLTQRANNLASGTTTTTAPARMGGKWASRCTVLVLVPTCVLRAKRRQDSGATVNTTAHVLKKARRNPRGAHDQWKHVQLLVLEEPGKCGEVTLARIVLELMRPAVWCTSRQRLVPVFESLLGVLLPGDRKQTKSYDAGNVFEDLMFAKYLVQVVELKQQFRTDAPVLRQVAMATLAKRPHDVPWNDETGQFQWGHMEEPNVFERIFAAHGGRLWREQLQKQPTLLALSDDLRITLGNRQILALRTETSDIINLEMMRQFGFLPRRESVPDWVAKSFNANNWKGRIGSAAEAQRCTTHKAFVGEKIRLLFSVKIDGLKLDKFDIFIVTGVVDRTCDGKREARVSSTAATMPHWLRHAPVKPEDRARHGRFLQLWRPGSALRDVLHVRWSDTKLSAAVAPAFCVTLDVMQGNEVDTVIGIVEQSIACDWKYTLETRQRKQLIEMADWSMGDKWESQRTAEEKALREAKRKTWQGASDDESGSGGEADPNRQRAKNHLVYWGQRERAPRLSALRNAFYAGLGNAMRRAHELLQRQ
jgi:hypothetical protein